MHNVNIFFIKRNLFKIIYILLFLFILIIKEIDFKRDNNKLKKIKIGVIGEHHSQNIGNNLLKYAMFTKLKEFGFEPDVIGYIIPGNNISYLEKIVNVRIIKQSYREIKRYDYDILMVNSDQVWRKENYFNLDVGFLKFSHNWNIKKFIYGASLGLEFWPFNRNENRILKHLLKECIGVSVREKGTMNLTENHLNIKPTLVIDPTLLIDKQYYLNLIKDYKNNSYSNQSYIFVYEIEKMSSMDLFINESIQKLNYKLYNCSMYDEDYLRKFIYGINISKAVITNSFHGVLFSIIFKKPFVAFNPESRGNERFNTLKDVYGLQKRIVSINNQPKISLLTEQFDVDMKIFDALRSKSIDYLKKNLGIT
jgi:polysaccharide pyruvyl transferase WcaK-like protein